jgi:hypothetical protein
MIIKPPAIEVSTKAGVEKTPSSEKLLTLAAKASLHILKATGRYFRKRTKAALESVIGLEKPE